MKGRRHEDGMFYGALYLLCLFCSFLIKEVSCGVPVPGLLYIGRFDTGVRGTGLLFIVFCFALNFLFGSLFGCLEMRIMMSRR